MGARFIPMGKWGRFGVSLPYALGTSNTAAENFMKSRRFINHLRCMRQDRDCLCSISSCTYPPNLFFNQEPDIERDLAHCIYWRIRQILHRYHMLAESPPSAQDSTANQ